MHLTAPPKKPPGLSLQLSLAACRTTSSPSPWARCTSSHNHHLPVKPQRHGHPVGSRMVAGATEIDSSIRPLGANATIFGRSPYGDAGMTIVEGRHCRDQPYRPDVPPAAVTHTKSAYLTGHCVVAARHSLASTSLHKHPWDSNKRQVGHSCLAREPRQSSIDCSDLHHHCHCLHLQSLLAVTYPSEIPSLVRRHAGSGLRQFDSDVS